MTVLEAIAAHGLDSAARWPATPASAAEWDELLRDTIWQRLTGLMMRAIDTGSLPVTETQGAVAADAHFAQMSDAVRLEAELLRTLDVIAGYDARVLKGSAVAHIDYDSPELRPFGDVDLLLRSSEYDAAIAALERAGYVRSAPEPRPGYDRRFGKGTCMTSPRGLELDVHRTLSTGRFGLTVDLDELWRTPTTFELAGREVSALGDHGRLLHACYHAVLGDRSPRLLTLRDVAEMALAVENSEAVVDVAAEWRSGVILATAITSAWERLSLTRGNDLITWAQAYMPSARELAALKWYRGAERSYTTQLVSSLTVIRGWRNRAAYVGALVFPVRNYVDGRYRSRRERWLNALRAANRHRRSTT